MSWSHERIEQLEQDVAALRNSMNGAYKERNHLVAYLSRQYPSHLALHPAEDTAWEKDWRFIVFVNAPSGQMSWHIHNSDLPMFQHLTIADNVWDGHTREEKYERLAKL